MLFFSRKKTQKQNQNPQMVKKQSDNIGVSNTEPYQTSKDILKTQSVPKIQDKTPAGQTNWVDNNQDFFNQSIIPPPNPQSFGINQPADSEQLKKTEKSKEDVLFNKTPETKVIDYKKVEEKSKLFDNFKKETEMEDPEREPYRVYKEGYDNKFKPEKKGKYTDEKTRIHDLKLDETEELLANKKEYDIKDFKEGTEHFISIDDYKQSGKEFNNLRRLLSHSEGTIDELNEEMGKQGNKLKELKDKVEDVERKIILIDKLLSEGGEDGGE